MIIQTGMRADINHRKIKITRKDGSFFPVLVLSPKSPSSDGLGILWLHGGGYMFGMKEMVFIFEESCRRIKDK